VHSYARLEFKFIAEVSWSAMTSGLCDDDDSAGTWWVQVTVESFLNHSEGITSMAWGGKQKTRMGVTQRKYFLKNTHRRLPEPDCPTPFSVPTTVMKTLQSENLSSDLTKYNERLQALLEAYKANGG
jgi:hypothetical protein